MLAALKRAYDAAARRPAVAKTLLLPEQSIEFYRLYAEGARAGPLPRKQGVVGCWGDGLGVILCDSELYFYKYNISLGEDVGMGLGDLRLAVTHYGGVQHPRSASCSRIPSPLPLALWQVLHWLWQHSS